MAEVISAGGRGVAASNGLALNLSGDGNVLSWGETKVVLRIRKTETVESGVVRDGDLLDERELAPFLRAEDRLTTCSQGGKKSVDARVLKLPDTYGRGWQPRRTRCQR